MRIELNYVCVCTKLLTAGELAFVDRYFEHPVERRLAFREYGTCLGVKCALLLSDEDEDDDLAELAADIIKQWDEAGGGSSDEGQVDYVLRWQRQPITQVMYAAALVPGGKSFSTFHIHAGRLYRSSVS